MSHRVDPELGITYVTLVDYYDKFMMLNTMEPYMHYISTLSPKRKFQLTARFSRRMVGTVS